MRRLFFSLILSVLPMAAQSNQDWMTVFPTNFGTQSPLRQYLPGILPNPYVQVLVYNLPENTVKCLVNLSYTDQNTGNQQATAAEVYVKDGVCLYKFPVDAVYASQKATAVALVAAASASN